MSKQSGGTGAIIVVIVVFLCLVGFAGKAFHMDDPLFLWTAKHIQESPGNFYGFNVNWYGTEMPMHEVTKNPPVTSYYIAMAGSIFGYSEIALHLAFLIPAIAAALGTYYLAKEFCVQPVIASLAAVLTPGFLVSSSNVMCDTMMLTFWVWAVLLWVRGIKRDKNLSLLFSALLIAMCALTKYFGMCLIPLLAVYSLMEKRKLGVWILFLLVPVAILAGYQFLTQALYGKGLLLDAASYVTHEKWVGRADFLTKGLTGLAFTGGCVITGLFFIPLLWSKRVLIVWVLLAAALVFTLSFMAKIGRFSVRSDDRIEWWFLLQLGLMVLGAVSIIAVSCVDLYRHRSAESLLLFLWLIGTFVFVSFINWTINARSILPMVPAVGILLMRRIGDRNKAADDVRGGWKISWPLVPAVIVAMLVCGGDYVWASSIRGAAGTISEKFQSRDNNIWFQGHWGFQYYMEAKGCKAMDFENSTFQANDVIIIPENNCNLIWPKEEMKKMLTQNEILKFDAGSLFATMARNSGAGFYVDQWGPVPFSLSKDQQDAYYTYFVKARR